MFGVLESKSANVFNPGESSLGKPIAEVPNSELTESERKDYEKLAEEIGFNPAAKTKERLLAHLRDNNIGIFPYSQVKNYLDKYFGNAEAFHGQKWGWRPLRSADVDNHDLVTWINRDEVDNGEFCFSGSYQAPVPIHVLGIVRDLINSVPNVYFFVSDVPTMRERMSSDPFLAVTCPGMEEMIIIAVWDEPSFRVFSE